MTKKLEILQDRVKQKLDFYNDNDEEWQMAKVRAYVDVLKMIDDLKVSDPPAFVIEWVKDRKSEFNSFYDAMNNDIQTMQLDGDEWSEWLFEGDKMDELAEIWLMTERE